MTCILYLYYLVTTLMKSLPAALHCHASNSTSPSMYRINQIQICKMENISHQLILIFSHTNLLEIYIPNKHRKP